MIRALYLKIEAFRVLRVLTWRENSKFQNSNKCHCLETECKKSNILKNGSLQENFGCYLYLIRILRALMLVYLKKWSLPWRPSTVFLLMRSYLYNNDLQMWQRTTSEGVNVFLKEVQSLDHFDIPQSELYHFLMYMAKRCTWKYEKWTIKIRYTSILTLNNVLNKTSGYWMKIAEQIFRQADNEGEGDSVKEKCTKRELLAK